MPQNAASDQSLHCLFELLFNDKSAQGHFVLTLQEKDRKGIEKLVEERIERKRGG